MQALRVAFAALILAAVLFADAQVAGKWSGSFVMDAGTGQAHDSTVVMNLKQDGANITGTVGPSEDQQWPVQKGKVEGDKVSLEVQSDGPLVKLDLVLAGDHLKGDAHVSANGQEMSAKVDAQRTK